MTLARVGALDKIDPSTLTFPEVTGHLGGVGVYSSLKEYLDLLRHLLQILGTSTSSRRLSPDRSLII